MLQLAGGIRLGVDIADLLELQASLQAQGIVQVPADEEHVVPSGEILGHLPDPVRLGQHLLQLFRKIQDIPDHGGVCLVVHGAHDLAEVQAQQVQHRHLGAVGLGGGHGDLRPGPGIQHVVGLPGNGGAHHVDDGQDAGAPLFGLPQGGHGIQRLAGLADDDDQVPFPYDGVAIAELGGQAHLHAAPQHPLQVILAHHAHMVRRAAGHDVDAADGPDLLRGHGQVLKHHAASLDPGGGGLADGGGLLHDLLEHEVGIAALFRSVHLPVHMVVLLFHRAQLTVVYPDAAAGQNGQLPVVHIGDVPGVADQGRHVGGDEVLPIAEAQQQGGVLPGGHQPVGIVGADNAQGIGPVHRVQQAVHGLKEVAAVAVVIVQQLGHHLRVRLGLEHIALLLQLLLQGDEVFDDAVVDHGELAALAHMGMGVDVVGLAVGGPAGVSDAQGAGQVPAVMGQLPQSRHPALFLAKA